MSLYDLQVQSEQKVLPNTVRGINSNWVAAMTAGFAEGLNKEITATHFNSAILWGKGIGDDTPVSEEDFKAMAGTYANYLDYGEAEGMNRAQMEFLIQLKKNEMRNLETIQGASGFGKGMSFAGMFAGTFADPVNMLSLFIPIMQAPRYLAPIAKHSPILKHILSKTDTILGKARLGATIGFTEAAVREPFIQAGQQYLQAEYHFRDSLMNLVAAPALGGVLGGSIGGVQKWIESSTAKATDTPYGLLEGPTLKDDLRVKEWKFEMLELKDRMSQPRRGTPRSKQSDDFDGARTGEKTLEGANVPMRDNFNSLIRLKGNIDKRIAARIAPAEFRPFKGKASDPMSPQNRGEKAVQWHLTEDLPPHPKHPKGHPKGSDVSGQTLRDYGFDPTPPSKLPTKADIAEVLKGRKVLKLKGKDGEPRTINLEKPVSKWTNKDWIAAVGKKKSELTAKDKSWVKNRIAQQGDIVEKGLLRHRQQLDLEQDILRSFDDDPRTRRTPEEVEADIRHNGVRSIFYSDRKFRVKGEEARKAFEDMRNRDYAERRYYELIEEMDAAEQMVARDPIMRARRRALMRIKEDAYNRNSHTGKGTAQTAMAKLFAQTFGRKIRFFDAEAGRTVFEAKGMVTNRDYKTIYLQEDSLPNMMYVAGHEMAHSIKYQNPALYRKLVKIVAEWDRLTGGELINRAVKDVFEQQGDVRGRLTDDQLFEEAFNNVFGIALQSDAFWRHMKKSNYQLFERMYSWLRRLQQHLGYVVGRMRSDGTLPFTKHVHPEYRGLDKMYEDLATTMKQIEGTTTAFERSQVKNWDHNAQILRGLFTKYSKGKPMVDYRRWLSDLDRQVEDINTSNAFEGWETGSMDRRLGTMDKKWKGKTTNPIKRAQQHAKAHLTAAQKRRLENSQMLLNSAHFLKGEAYKAIEAARKQLNSLKNEMDTFYNKPRGNDEAAIKAYEEKKRNYQVRWQEAEARVKLAVETHKSYKGEYNRIARETLSESPIIWRTSDENPDQWEFYLVQERKGRRRYTFDEESATESQNRQSEFDGTKDNLDDLEGGAKTELEEVQARIKNLADEIALAKAADEPDPKAIEAAVERQKKEFPALEAERIELEHDIARGEMTALAFAEWQKRAREKGRYKKARKKGEKAPGKKSRKADEDGETEIREAETRIEREVSDWINDLIEEFEARTKGVWNPNSSEAANRIFKIKSFQKRMLDMYGYKMGTDEAAQWIQEAFWSQYSRYDTSTGSLDDLVRVVRGSSEAMSAKHIYDFDIQKGFEPPSYFRGDGIDPDFAISRAIEDEAFDVFEGNTLSDISRLMDEAEDWDVGLWEDRMGARPEDFAGKGREAAKKLQQQAAKLAKRLKGLADDMGKKAKEYADRAKKYSEEYEKAMKEGRPLPERKSLKERMVEAERMARSFAKKAADAAKDAADAARHSEDTAEWQAKGRDFARRGLDAANEKYRGSPLKKLWDRMSLRAIATNMENGQIRKRFDQLAKWHKKTTDKTGAFLGLKKEHTLERFSESEQQMIENVAFGKMTMTEVQEHMASAGERYSTDAIRVGNRIAKWRRTREHTLKDMTAMLKEVGIDGVMIPNNATLGAAVKKLAAWSTLSDVDQARLFNQLRSDWHRYKNQMNENGEPATILGFNEFQKTEIRRKARIELQRQAKETQLVSEWQAAKERLGAEGFRKYLGAYFDGVWRKGLKTGDTRSSFDAKKRVQVTKDTSLWMSTVAKHNLGEELTANESPLFKQIVRFYQTKNEALLPKDPKRAAAVRELAEVLELTNRSQTANFHNAGVDVRYNPHFWHTQQHNRSRIVNNAEGWMSYMMANVDWEKTWIATGRDAAARNDSGNRAYLEEVFKDIENERLRNIDPDSPEIIRNMSKEVEQARTIHFKEGKDFGYDKMFGSGDPYRSFIEGMQRRAELTAIFNEFGPNPEKMFNLLMKETGTNPTEGGLSSPQKMFDYAIGKMDDPIDGDWSNRRSMLMQFANATYLGMSGISALVDVAHSINAMRFLGVDMGTLSKQYWENLWNAHLRQGDANAVAYFRYLGAGADVMLNSAARRITGDTPTGTMARKLNNFIFTANGLNYWTTIAQEAVVDTLTRTMGSPNFVRDHPHMMKVMEERYGITRSEFEEVFQYRQSVDELGDIKLTKSDKEGEFIDVVERLSPDMFELSHPKTANKMRNFLEDWIRQGVIEPDATSQIWVRLGLRDGTPAGATIRAMTQYMSFGFATYRKTYMRMLNAYGEQGFMAMAANPQGRQMMDMLSFMGWSLGLGLISMNLKEISRGREPVHPGNINMQTAKRWAFQSGIAGPLSDLFWARDLNDVAGMALGPSIGGIAQVGNELITGDIRGTLYDLERNTPFATMPVFGELRKRLLSPITGDAYIEGQRAISNIFDQDVLFFNPYQK